MYLEVFFNRESTTSPPNWPRLTNFSNYSLKIITSDKKMVAGIITEMPARFRDVFTELVSMASGGQISFPVADDSDLAGDQFKTCHFQINLAYSSDVSASCL